VTRSIHLALARLPTGLASYPRVLLNRRPAVEEVTDPPVVEAAVRNAPLDARKIEAYAAICGFGRGSAPPVTFPHVLAMPLHLRIFATEVFPLRPMGLIHLENVIEVPGELRPGMRFDISVSARNYRALDAGLAFDMATEITSAGEPVWRETCVFLSRWAEGSARPAGRPPRPPKAPRDATVLGSQIEVSQQTAWRYARVSRDFNPIHLNDRAARYFGLRGAIMHGMWSLARSLAEAPPPRAARIDTTFLTPVQLPARVVIKEWSENGQRRRALCDVRTGRVHMYAHWPESEG